MQYAPTLTVDYMGSFCKSPDLDAPSDIPGKGANVVFGLCRWAIDWGHSGPMVPVCGAYAVAPYVSGFSFFVRQGRGATAYAPSDVPDKGTNAVFGLCRWVIDWGRPGPAVPVCGAYAIRPYPDGRLFSSKWVGRNSIRPTRRPRQGDECGCPVISQGHLFGSSGPYFSSATRWGLAPTGPHLLFLS